MLKPHTYTRITAALLPCHTLETDLFLLGTSGYIMNTINYHCYYHSQKEPHDFAPELFQEALDDADMVVGQNIKFDLSWIRECGFVYDGEIYDTMVAEYVLQKRSVGLLDLLLLQKSMTLLKRRKTLLRRISKRVRHSTTYRGR